MVTYSIHKGAGIAPRKARMTLDLIRNASIDNARAILINTNTKASPMILKVLNSAVANAVNNFHASETDLVIKEAYIGEGRTLKRQKAASRSKVAKNYHRTSHIFISVTDGKQGEEELKELVEKVTTKKSAKKSDIKEEAKKDGE